MSRSPPVFMALKRMQCWMENINWRTLLGIHLYLSKVLDLLHAFIFTYATTDLRNTGPLGQKMEVMKLVLDGIIYVRQDWPEDSRSRKMTGSKIKTTFGVQSKGFLFWQPISDILSMKVHLLIKLFNEFLISTPYFHVKSIRNNLTFYGREN